MEGEAFPRRERSGRQGGGGGGGGAVQGRRVGRSGDGTAGGGMGDGGMGGRSTGVVWKVTGLGGGGMRRGGGGLDQPGWCDVEGHREVRVGWGIVRGMNGPELKGSGGDRPSGGWGGGGWQVRGTSGPRDELSGV